MAHLSPEDRTHNLGQITWDFLYFSYWNNIPLPPLPQTMLLLVQKIAVTVTDQHWNGGRGGGKCLDETLQIKSQKRSISSFS